jgi:hypothetical protein
MHFSIPEFLSDESSLGVFLLVSVLLGGGAAWLAGRALAATWRPWWHVLLYMVILSFAVRFLHYALFDGKFLSLHYYLVDYGVCLGLGLLGFRLQRVADGHPLQLDQRARRPLQLASPRRYDRRGHAKIRVTFPPFAANRAPRGAILRRDCAVQ